MSAAFRILLLLSLFSLLTAQQQDQRQILLNLKSSLKSSNFSKLFDSWNDTISVCSFNGVTCNTLRSVTEINLSNQNLTGVLPFDSLCNLPSLQKLAFGYNGLYGNVSEDIRKCVTLRYLDLGNNLFSGPFPDISPLNQLEYLFLNKSGFSGTFPWQSLLNMTGLLQLSVGDNPFDFTPFPKEVVSLKKLNWLYLSNCTLGGKLPVGLGNLTELTDLEFSDNYITGEFPAEIVNLRKLWQLEFFNNSFTGKIPTGLRNLTGLKYLDGSMNRLEGDLSELKYLTNLVSLQFFENNLSGEIPDEIGEFKGLKALSLYRNKLTGPIPQKVGSWAEFEFIDVSENFLSGTIPPEMCKKGKMTALLVLQNNLSGEIPATYGDCWSMKRFRVSNNSLSGTVPPAIWGLPNAEIIDIELNQFEGSLASDIRNAKTLGSILARQNRLSGEIPEEISKATSLVTVDLSENQISGKIPEGIGELKELGSLHLQSNRLSGSIPESLGSCKSLNDIDLSRNLLSGEIPNSLGSFPALNSLNLSDNDLSGEIPGGLAFLRLSLFDLSYNRLTGPIPQALTLEAYNGSLSGNPGLCSVDAINSFPRCSSSSGMSKDMRDLVICFAIASILLLSCLGVYLQLKRRKEDGERFGERSLKEESWDVKSFHVLSFSEGEILDSIKQENLIGKGGSGNVYRVTLSNGKELAVKHIWNTDVPARKKSWSSTPMLGNKQGGKSKEFDAEVQALSSIRHVNVVKLYCSITSEDSSLLVYEYLPNGSLWDRLHTSRKMELDWETRYEIAVGAAKGLEYLHHGCERPVIHRDVKSSNILLDEFLKPRIADFGLAKVIQANVGKDSSSRVIAGTHGYIAPEYGYTYKVNEKSDVYSFGVVLMELVTGKRPNEAEFGENKDLVSWVHNMARSKEGLRSAVDSRIPEIYKEEACKVLRTAVLCTGTLPALRPTMRAVVQKLEDAEPCKLVGIVISKDGGEKKIGVNEKK
ncbi:receptor-like protein kinase HAIKU2 [Vigna radiata var. radiata]|uniref:non-specific serine/threonine protein kinase n=1 Tax=Vigna radiata var. radiata TaxID=3916 RepID=A0A1S3U614_VIGRR|nr:receptor-like protein kinase HAIKU2 [Vigna radiata var. radiata]